ncbi:glycoside hydrolase family 47 protein [Mycena pura]|uniref:alpha-1,2-Mannosidase n=1 Tax=Mycena pura TaxID=153505 RepID=A0AAD6VIJ4_9AGAR|nr:glycoside hydrolase family 47 protein [Mycena pura]
MRLLCTFAVLGLSSCALAGGVTVQKQGLQVPNKYKSQRDAVQKIFTTSWDAYRQFAFGHDELLPVSKGTGDDLGGWGATIVDALGTFLVMGLNDDFNSTLDFISKVDFNTSPVPGTVSVFETTIRWVGGLLSAYELSNKQHPILLEKAKEVADKMAFAWIGDNAIPFGHIDFSDNSPDEDITNIAEAGTLSLEWFTLSEFTGNQTYAKLAVGSVEQIASLGTPLPGLAPQLIDPSSGQFADAYITWGGGSDSYFEYLLKFARLTNTDNTVFIDTWKSAVDSSIQHLLKFSTVGNHAYLADQDDQGLIRHVGSHLACFYAGNWLLGGKLLNNQTIVDIALQLNDGCWNTYASTATGIGPETFAFISADGNFTGGGSISPAQLAFFEKNGFYITGSDYIQRPEVLESNFYAWRVTGDTKYLDRAQAAVASFNKFLPTTVAFACLNDVNNPNGGFIDDMESFWFAEVLKYLYLTFDDPSHISLDEFVFNTECHPLKAPPALNSYGSGKAVSGKPFTPHFTNAPRPAVSPH